jgi:TolA-binding protein
VSVRIAPLALALVVFSVGDARALGDDPKDAFRAATELIGQDDAKAEASFEAIAEQHPKDEFAADALLEAAQLSEEKLGRPDRAAELYGKLLERYPTNRLSLRARARHEFLVANLKAGNAPLAEYQDILMRYSTRAPEESVARMEKLIASHPDFPLADEARLWLARGDLAAGRFEEAARRYRAIEERAPNSPAALQARKGRADAELAAGHPLDARKLYQALATDGDRPIAEAARVGIDETSRAVGRLVTEGLTGLYLIFFLAACGWQGRKHLRRVPFELKFYLPVAALFVLAGATENRAIAFATGGIAVGGAIVVWLGGAATAARIARGPISLLQRSIRAGATALAVGALVYGAVFVTHLTDLVVETLRNGPDR